MSNTTTTARNAEARAATFKNIGNARTLMAELAKAIDAAEKHAESDRANWGDVGSSFNGSKALASALAAFSADHDEETMHTALDRGWHVVAVLKRTGGTV